MVIGITGTSGCGKTTVSKVLRDKLNCSIVDADSVAKNLSKKGSNYYYEIVKAFGNEILDKDKELVRSKLAEIIYNDDSKREILNNLTNIYVVDEIKKEVFKLYNKNTVIIDAPRLIESGLNSICDIVIGVIADYKIKLDRICKRDNIFKEVAIERLGIQPDNQYYIDNSYYIISNNINDDLEKQIEYIVKELK